MSSIFRILLVLSILFRTFVSYVVSTIRDIVILIRYGISLGWWKSYSPLFSYTYGLSMDRQWFQRAVNNCVGSMYHGYELKSVDLKLMTGNRGQSSQPVFCGSIEISSNSDVSPPTKVVLKCSSIGIRGRFLSNLRMIQREGLVYESTLFQNNSIPLLKIPKLWFQQYSIFARESMVLLEDLRSNCYGFPAIDIFGGFKCTPKYTKEDRMYTIQLFCQILAKLHSKYWCSEDLIRNYPFFCGHSFYMNLLSQQNYAYHEAAYDVGIQFAKSKWPVGLQRFAKNKAYWANKLTDYVGMEEGTANFPFRLSAKVVDFIEKSLAQSKYFLFLHALQDQPFTLCHGDIHADNIYISPTSGNFYADKRLQLTADEIYFYDLQEVGIYNPMFDVSELFFVSCIRQHRDSVEETVQLAENMIRLYYEALLNQGITTMSLEQCRKGFFRSALEKMTWAFCFFAANEDAILGFVQFLHDNILFYLDHGNLDCDCIPLRPLVLN